MFCFCWSDYSSQTHFKTPHSIRFTGFARGRMLADAESVILRKLTKRIRCQKIVNQTYSRIFRKQNQKASF